MKAKFIATTEAYNHIAVEDLHTPIGIVSSALIRTKDIQRLVIDIGKNSYKILFIIILFKNNIFFRY